ncbi:hypothetical protein EGW08_008712 [Elysia chlorotica]|uniref:UBX domain-containing protein 11 n=1 Tax=Elysia chlorotica TaxID=188477 RepID=A0A3S1BA85_ELYCH|nr:hypothetical protein EGW08_008712 [Elysia chlorotica]
MSSPLNSLRKNKVPLFPGHMSGNRPIPFRHPEYSEDESKLLEEITTAMVLERRKKDQPLTLPSLGVGHSNDKVPSMLKRFGGGVGTLPGVAASVETDTPTDGRNSTSPREPPSDKELMRLMMNRIAVLEQANQTKEDELRSKDKRIKVLEDRLQIAEKARRDAGPGTAMRELETHCLLLQQQVHEMETFLAEYGLVWVGESLHDNSDVYIDDGIYDDSDNDDDQKDPSLRRNASTLTDNTVTSDPFGLMWRQDTSLASGGSDSSVPSAVPNSVSLNIDFNRLIENINDLNVLAGAGVAQIKKTSDGARFEIPESVQLTIYANGILMFDGPFRPYAEPTTRQCVQDLLDGYFPSELQRRYPDGVPFVVTDLRGTFYQTKAGSRAFAGEGQTLGGDTGPSRLIPTRVVDQSKKIALPTVPGMAASSQTAPTGEPTHSVSSHMRKPMTQAQFLNKLPKSVIRDGKIIDIRDSIGNSLSGTEGKPSTSKSNVTLINTSVTKEMSESVAQVGGAVVAAASSSSGSAQRPKSSYQDVTTLRVVTEQGAHTYIVKMKFTETIGNLRTYLDTQRRPTAPYDIVSTFPHKIHKNNNLTLEASGLTPNAVLHLKPHKQ